MNQQTGNSNTDIDKKRGAEGATWIPVLAAVITAIATIIVALLSSPVIIKMLEIKLTPTSVISSLAPPTSAITETVTPVQIVFTETVTPVQIIFTETPTPIIIPTDTPPSSRILVILAADIFSGKSPLTVKFDARSSYLLTSDGVQHPCQKTGACHYTWKVYFNGQQSERSDTESGGSFRHTFRDKGRHTVVVQICWGQDRLYCAESSAFIEVTK